MPRKGIFILLSSVFSMVYTLFIGFAISALAQDPDLPDSMIIGNLDRSIIMTDIGQQILIPVWIKTDDSVTFMHTPLASKNTYFTSRTGGVFYPPLSLWDDVSFKTPNNNSPSQGWTNQSLLGYAFTSPPRDPQNFLYTDYQWVHIADFRMIISADTSIYGDTTNFMEGFNPYYGYLIWSIQDGVTQFEPQTIYSQVTFVSNIMPVITEPADSAAFDVNLEFPFSMDVIATDADLDNIALTVDAPFSNYQFIDIQTDPGYSHKRFMWTPTAEYNGDQTVVFTANDGSGGVDEHSMILNVSPSILSIAEISILLGADVDLPISLINNGINSYVGGFEILVQYDSPMICLTGVTRAERLANWDYFYYALGDSSTIRIVGLADVTGHGQDLPPGEGPIIFLHFQVTDDEQYMGQYAWIHFISGDHNDNTISDSTGYLLINPSLDDGWISVIDPDDILIADINLNLIAWEISDAVLLANYLVNPDDFPLSQIQLLASDTNNDDQDGTVADLIYLLNVVLGVMHPPKISYGGDIAAVISVEDPVPADGRYDVVYNSGIPAGGALVKINHSGSEIGEVISATDLNMQTLDKNGILSVLIFDIDGGYINPDSRLFEIEVVSGEFEPTFSEIQVSDRFGNAIPADGRVTLNLPDSYRLLGAYPNPFNSSTLIGFSLPVASDVEITIYNIMGQTVRTLKAENMLPGQGSLTWDGTGNNGQSVASGVYLYSLNAGEFSASSRMVLIK